jgi:hypothetical protein
MRCGAMPVHIDFPLRGEPDGIIGARLWTNNELVERIGFALYLTMVDTANVS